MGQRISRRADLPPPAPSAGPPFSHFAIFLGCFTFFFFFFVRYFLSLGEIVNSDVLNSFILLFTHSFSQHPQPPFTPCCRYDFLSCGFLCPTLCGFLPVYMEWKYTALSMRWIWPPFYRFCRDAVCIILSRM